MLFVPFAILSSNTQVCGRCQEAKCKHKEREASGKMKTGKDRGEDLCDSKRKDNVLGRNKTPQCSDRGTGQSVEVCGEFVPERLGPSTFVERAFSNGW